MPGGSSLGFLFGLSLVGGVSGFMLLPSRGMLRDVGCCLVVVVSAMKGVGF